MAKEWTDEEVQKEIADAVAIVREDRFEKFWRSRTASPTDDKNGGDDKSGNGGSGGGKNDPPIGGETKKKSLFWGDV